MDEQVVKETKEVDELYKKETKEARETKEVDEIYKKHEEQDFPIIIGALLDKLISELEYSNTKKSSVTKMHVNMARMIKDKISVITLDAYKKLTVAETQITEKLNTNRILQELAVSISEIKDQAKERKIEQEFSVILTPKEDTKKIEDLKPMVKKIHKDENLANPQDIIITKTNKLILKMNNKDEMENLASKLQENEEIKKSLNIKSSRRGRKRLLLLGVDKEIGEQEVRQELSRIMEDVHRDYEIIDSRETKAGTMNWTVETDLEGEQRLLDKKHINLGFERIRIVKKISIIRCFKCQSYGHMSSKCTSVVTYCPKCAENHQEKIVDQM